MTRRDYVLIAEALQRVRADIALGADETAAGRMVSHVCDLHAESLSESLGDDNSAFQPSKFLAASGMEVDDA
jgi:hypothetical protein